MANFVINVLIHHKGPIHKFELSARMEMSWPIVDGWLYILPRNEIRELVLHWGSDINSCCSKWLQVHSIVYSYKKLAHLELYECKMDPPPLTFTGFLFLRCLTLVNVFISLEDIESIVANSPLLETLKLDDCCSDDGNLELKISAPSLKYLDLECNPIDSIRLYLDAPLLAEMSVTLSFMDYDELEFQQCSRVEYNYANFFVSCNSLQKLKGNYFTMVMSYGVDSWQYSFVLPCLKVIELDEVKYGVVKEMLIVARLVTGAPNLQKLKLVFDSEKEEIEALAEEEEDEEEAKEEEDDEEVDDEEDASNSDSEAPDVPYKDFLSAPSFKWEKLKMITVSSFSGLPSMMQFFKLLLENSPALERMNLQCFFQAREYLRTEVLKFNLASPNFTLCFP